MEAKPTHNNEIGFLLGKWTYISYIVEMQTQSGEEEGGGVGETRVRCDGGYFNI